MAHWRIDATTVLSKQHCRGVPPACGCPDARCAPVEPEVLTSLMAIKKPALWTRFGFYGALGGFEPPSRSVRSRVLYPAELRVRYLVFPRPRTIGEGRVGVN